MVTRLIALLAASLPSSVKYRLGWARPAYVRLMRLWQPLIEVETRAGKITWQIDALTSQRHLLGTYEPHMQDAFCKYVQSGSVVFDIGAHAGFHSLFCGLLVRPAGQVFAFEPNPISNISLSEQVRKNPGLGITVLPVALSDFSGTATFDASMDSQSRLAETGEVMVKVDTIDRLVAAEIPAPNIIKIDVEGHEERVLKGSMETLARYRPVVLVDWNDSMTFQSVSALLAPLGYHVLSGPPVTALPYSEESATTATTN